MACSELKVLTETHKLCYSHARRQPMFETDDDDDDDNGSIASADNKGVSDTPESEMNNLSLAEELALIGSEQNCFPMVNDISVIPESGEWDCDSGTCESFHSDNTETLTTQIQMPGKKPLIVIVREKDGNEEVLSFPTFTDKCSIRTHSGADHTQQYSMITSTPLKQIGTFQEEWAEPVNATTNSNACLVNFFHESDSTSMDMIRQIKRPWQHRQKAAEDSECSSRVISYCNGFIRQDTKAPFSSFDQAIEATLRTLIREHRDHFEIHTLLTDDDFINELKADTAEVNESYKTWCHKRVDLHTSCSVFPSEIAEQGARHVIMEAVYNHIDEMTNSKHASAMKYRFLSCRDQLISENTELKADIQELKDQKDTLESKLHALREKKFQLMKDWRKIHRELRAGKKRMRHLEDQILTVRELTAQNIKVSGEDIHKETIKRTSNCSVM